ncbi:MAG: metal ABC transporter permease [Candidatus Woesearchaeota archaeon]
MIELFQFEFIRNAFLAAILISIACGIVGTYVVIRRIVFISGGIAHAAFGGIGLGILLGINPLVTAIPFSLSTAVGIGTLSRNSKLTEDSLIGILWSLGMALGILFIGLTPGYTPDLFSYLFGSILTVTTNELILMAVLDLLIVALVIYFFKELTAISFDEEFSRIAGIPTRALYILLLCLVSLSIILLIKIVGIILVMALLTFPTVLSRQFINRLKPLMITSTIVAVTATLIGLLLSYFFDLPSGATIVLFLTALLLATKLMTIRHAN